MLNSCNRTKAIDNSNDSYGSRNNSSYGNSGC